MPEMRRWWTLAHRLVALSATTCILFALASGQNSAPSQGRSITPIILISVDTLRADHLSCYGYSARLTKHIDRIAATGTLFQQVNSQVPLTLPSHVSLLTSTYPFANGIEDNGERLAPNAVTIARVLKAQGYRTAAFVGSFVLDRRFGLDQGFDIYDSPSSLHSQPGRDPGEIRRSGEDVTRLATEWLDRNADHPFFLFVHLYDLHTPYKLAASDQPRGSAYDNELRYVDEVLGKFWDFLGRRGLIERALVVFTSDHGESLREHGESTHGYFVYQSTLRVPLIMHWPRQMTPFAAEVTEPVSLLDVAPTLVQFAGFARPAKFQGHNLLSLTVSPVSAAAKASSPEQIYSESLYPHTHFGTSALRSLRIGPYQYIQAPRPEFYDLVHDPAEKQNLYETQKPLAVTFRERLDLVGARHLSKRSSASQPMRPDAIEQLKSLGYIGEGVARSPATDSGVDPKDRINEYEKYGGAIVLASSGHLSASNATLEKLLDKHPNLLDVRASLGLNQQKLGHYAEAAENFKAILKQNPRSAVAHLNLAVSEQALGHSEEAFKELGTTLALAPYYVRAEEMLVSLCLQRKNYDLARSHLNHLIEMDPGSYTAHYNLGVLDTLQGNWQEADRHLRAAIQADSVSVEAHNTLGSLHLRRGDLESARKEFKEAIRLNPEFASAHYNLGIIFRLERSNERAAREFREALAADPQFEPARKALDRLHSATNEAE